MTSAPRPADLTRWSWKDSVRARARDAAHGAVLTAAPAAGLGQTSGAMRTEIIALQARLDQRNAESLQHTKRWGEPAHTR
jgi:hypothetical protein